MSPRGDLFSIDEDVQTAHSAFRSTASQRLKRLLSLGFQGSTAALTLLDDLIGHRVEHLGAAAPSTSMQRVVDSTGASPDAASKILQLGGEISRLRAEGHSTASLIEEMQRRMRDSGKTWHDEWDENGEQACAQLKKRRIGDMCSVEKARTQLSRAQPSKPCPTYATDRQLCVCDELGHEHIDSSTSCGARVLPSTQQCVPMSKAGGEKRVRATDEAWWRGVDEPSPLLQLKKLKLQTQAEK